MAATSPTGYDVRKRGCPSQGLLDLIADKWSAIVIKVLAGRTVRYLQLQREVEGISQKMLTQTLQSLERNGLVCREVYAVVPPRVEYRLSPLGETLVPILQDLCGWAEEHMKEVLAAQQIYDALKERAI